MLSEVGTGEFRRQELQNVQQRQAKNRGRLDTVAEIVKSCFGGANKSRIMLTANVNSVVATEMINSLMDSGLLSPRKEEGQSVTYHATQEGLEFVNRYSSLVSMLRPGIVAPSRIDEIRPSQAWI
jgi:predicted transcriptional regulator